MGRNIIVNGLAFGDEGKGSVVDFLARRVDNPLVVRFNGGSQAAHNVVLPDKTHHTFAQFGSGTLAGAPTHLSQFTVLNPANMLTEAEHLREIGVADPFKLLTVARGALIITPYHIAANRMREDARGDARHGSCGQGIGETVESAMRFPASAVRAGDLYGLGSWPKLRDKLAFWREVKRAEMLDLGLDLTDTIFEDDEVELRRYTDLLGSVGSTINIVPDDWLERQYDRHDVIFEGAQGVLLDERLGFHPHTTWSKCTPHNAKVLLNGRDVFTLGVTRSYTTRHGAGPFPTDMGSLGARMFREHHNGLGEYQGAFRIGGLDIVALRYATRSLEALGLPVDAVALTHCGRMNDEMPICFDYDREEPNPNPGVWGKTTWRMRVQEIPTFDDERHPEPCLEHQEKITDMITGVTPVYEIASGRAVTLAIEEALKTEVKLESWGPTYEDKKDYLPWVTRI